MRRLPEVATWVLGVALLALSSLRALRLPLTVSNVGDEHLAGAMARDFLDAVYLPVREANAGGDPYLPQNMFDRWGAVQEFDLYAPFHLLLHAPLGWLSELTAWRVYVLFLWVVLALTLTLAARGFGEGDPSRRLVLVGAFLFVEPAKFAIWYGNVNPLIWLGATVMLTSGRRHAWAAVLASPLVWIKPQYGLPVTLVLLALGHRGRALGGLLLTVAASLPTAVTIVVREGGPAAFLDVVRANLNYAQGTAYGRLDSVETTRIDGYASLFALGVRVPGGEFVVTFAVLAVLVLVLLVMRRRGLDLRVGEVGDPLFLMLTASATYLVLVHSMGEVFLLAIPLLAAVLLVLRQEFGWVSWPLAVALLLALVVVMSTVSAQTFAVDRLGEGAPRLVIGWVMWALYIFSVTAALAWRPRQARPGVDVASPGR